MQGSGALNSYTSRRQRAAVALAAIVVGVVGASVGSSSAHAATPVVPQSTASHGHLWALEPGADGRPVVVRADAAPRASSRLGAASGAFEPDTVVHALDDPLEPQQWGLAAAGFRGAWPATTGGGVIVAVIDTGVRRTHQDLAGAVLPGIDLVTGSGDGSNDQNGHGTHVAGIIAARRNGVGGTGGAPGVAIMPIRVLDANGSGYTSDVAQGIIYATDHGARVVNLSLGGPQPSSSLQTAIQYARSHGVVVVAAAGNYGAQGNPIVYPGAYPEAVAVAAVDSNLQHASFSETGSYVDIAAPGVNVLSDWGNADNAYAWASGTSMATPFVSAAAALVVATHPTFTSTQVIDQLEATATDLGAPGVDPVFGAGLVNPALAVQGGGVGTGLWVVGANGRVRALGGAHWYGDLAGMHLSAPVVASSPTPTHNGYWLATADGHVYAYGWAHHYGDMAGRTLWAPIVAMAATPSGHGYWLLAADGGVFSFGDAQFHGSTGGMRLNAPVLDLTPTVSGHGYWFVAADGGVFCFGDAKFRGSTGAMHLWQPVASMTAAASGQGYWLVARDGGIFTFGVPFHGSLATRAAATGPTSGVRIRAFANGGGYYILTAAGAAYPFGSARNFGVAQGLGAPAVDMMLVP